MPSGADIVVYGVTAAAVGAAVLLGWQVLPAGATGTVTATAANTSVQVVLHPTANLSVVGGEYADAVGVFCAPRHDCDVNGSTTIHLATDRPRMEVVETYAHELEHLRLESQGLTVEEEHEIIARRNTVAGMEGAFWNWPAATWTIVPRL